eukprot:3432410-Pyramimonas_sp.AAC.1
MGSSRGALDVKFDMPSIVAYIVLLNSHRTWLRFAFALAWICQKRMFRPARNSQPSNKYEEYYPSPLEPMIFVAATLL